MWSRRSVQSALLLLLLVMPAAAQRNRSNVQNAVDIHVRVTWENDRPAGQMLRVELLNESSVPVQQLFTNGEGEVNFRITGEGAFHVRVTGTEIQEAVSESVAINPLDRSRTIFARVKPRTDAKTEATNPELGKMTSAAELRIPQEARKLFDKATDAWKAKEYQQAGDYYQQAIKAYPKYDAAYNNLGVVYMKLDRVDDATAAFETAVKLNEKDADADRNLARVLIRKGDYPKAEDFAKKSLAVDPSEPSGLLLVAISELQTGQFAAAIRNAQRVHQLPHDGFASCHYVAGQAFEHLNQLQSARVEYQLYLQELPDGPDALDVRAGLSRIDDQIANGQ